MIETIKKLGNITLDELSKKQVITLLILWDCNYAKRENKSFTEMLARCYKSSPWHRNAPIHYIHTDNVTVTTIPHAFSDLTEEEEELVINAIMKNN